MCSKNSVSQRCLHLTNLSYDNSSENLDGLVLITPPGQEEVEESCEPTPKATSKTHIHESSTTCTAKGGTARHMPYHSRIEFPTQIPHLDSPQEEKKSKGYAVDLSRRKPLHVSSDTLGLLPLNNNNCNSALLTDSASALTC